MAKKTKVSNDISSPDDDRKVVAASRKKKSIGGKKGKTFALAHKNL